MSVDFTRQALIDYERVGDEAFTGWPLHARSIVKRLDDAVELLERLPLMGELVDPPISIVPGMRVFSTSPCWQVRDLLSADREWH